MNPQPFIDKEWAYQYLVDKVTGKYMGLVRKDDKGNFPANSVPIPPPFPGDPWMPVWDFQKNVWTVERREVVVQNSNIEKFIESKLMDFQTVLETHEKVMSKGLIDHDKLIESQFNNIKDDIDRLYSRYVKIMTEINDIKNCLDRIYQQTQHKGIFKRLWNYLFG